MKNTHKTRLLLVAAALSVSASSAFAATYTWQTAGTTNTWSATAGNANWFIDAGSTLSEWADSNAAVFSGAGETVTVSGSVSPSSITVGSGNGDWTIGVSAGNIIGGTGTLVKTGTGTLSFTGTNVQNTFSGGTTISQGTVTYTSTSGGGNSQMGASIRLNDTNTGSANTSLIANATAQLFQAINVQNFGTGTTTIGAAAGVTGASFTQTVTANKALTLQGGGTDRTDFSGIAGSGDITIANAGTGTARVMYLGTNTNTGNLTINSGAKLQLGQGGTINTSQIGDASLVTVNGTLNWAKASTTAETVGAFAGSGTIGSAAGNALFTLGNGSGNFSGTITGTTAITKNGTGVQTLSGANTYSNGTTITAGTLVTGNTAALGTGNVTLNGGKLQVGDGTVHTVALASAKNITATAASTLAFDSATSAITLTGGGKYDFTGQTITLDLNSAFNSANTYNLITGGTSNVDASSYLFTNFDTTNFTASFSNGSLVVTAVPEPSTYGLMGAGALAAAAFVRRRRKAA